MLIGNNRAKICFFCVKKDEGVVIYLKRTTMHMKQKDFKKKLLYEILLVTFMFILLVLILNNI
jgi:hypothetical protein